MKLPLVCGLIGLMVAAPVWAAENPACDAASGVFDIVAERYEPMQAGGGKLMLSLARVSIAAGRMRVYAEGAGWDPAIVDTLVKLQESPATDGKGGPKPTAESSPDYVLGLAKLLAEQIATPCEGYEFTALP